jgi:hypothetical protein
MLVSTKRLGRIVANGRLNSSPVVGCERVYSNSGIDAKEKQLYTERQAKLNRPVSPHVTIYAFPVVAISSIMNRVTGVALSGKQYLRYFLFLERRLFYHLCLVYHWTVIFVLLGPML